MANRRAKAAAAEVATATRQRVAQTLPLGIAETCRRVSITLRAIRHYECLGLLLPRRINGARVYGATELRSLELLQRFKAMGLSLTECRNALRCFGQPTSGRSVDDGADPQGLIQSLQRRRHAIDSMVAELRLIRDEASATLAGGRPVRRTSRGNTWSNTISPPVATG